MRKVVFLGATRGMGRALARRMAERGDRLVLLGRDPEELSRSAADLGARAEAGAAGAVWTVGAGHEDEAGAGGSVKTASDFTSAGVAVTLVTPFSFSARSQSSNCPRIAARRCRGGTSGAGSAMGLLPERQERREDVVLRRPRHRSVSP